MITTIDPTELPPSLPDAGFLSFKIVTLKNGTCIMCKYTPSPWAYIIGKMQIPTFLWLIGAPHMGAP